MPRASLLVWKRLFTDAGYTVELFGYPTIFGNSDSTIQRLHRKVADQSYSIVAHSLGGVIALNMLEQHECAVERVVCMGSPISGSTAAQHLNAQPVLKYWVGGSREILMRGCHQWPASVQVGMIAGNVPRGLGGIVAGFKDVHDGTVSLRDTQHPCLTDHIVLPVSHTGLLASRQAVSQAVHFLQQGGFDHINS